MQIFHGYYLKDEHGKYHIGCSIATLFFEAYLPLVDSGPQVSYMPLLRLYIIPRVKSQTFISLASILWKQ